LRSSRSVFIAAHSFGLSSNRTRNRLFLVLRRPRASFSVSTALSDATGRRLSSSSSSDAAATALDASALSISQQIAFSLRLV
jgi:hypothetical protein